MSTSNPNYDPHNHVFKLTLALYRVTDFFPQNEPLRKHLREKANEIFAAVFELPPYWSNQTNKQTNQTDLSDQANRSYQSDPTNHFPKVLSKIRAIQGYLDLARSLRFVRPINLTVLEREYESLSEFISASPNLPNPLNQPAEPEPLPTWNEFSASLSTPPKKTVSTKLENGSQNGVFNPRQKTILEYLGRTKQAKISDFYSVFTGVSSKTIQRDLQDLVAKNVLAKEGEKRWTVYSVVSDRL